ncbi:MAG: response regulator [Deltaproteobacteria bacterium]|nr:response regulator [Deltaproteobacteria bacterium]
MTTETKLPMVVCVDDDDQLLATVVRSLRKEPIQIRWTTCASEALGWIASDEVAVLVSDYEMPEMTGAQLAGHARRIRPETVRILLTGRKTLDTAIDGINQGEIFRFLSKPFEPDVLRKAVNDGVARNKELIAMSGDRERRERREALRGALEQEFPGISYVTRIEGQVHEVPADPWAEAALLGLVGLTKKLEG